MNHEKYKNYPTPGSYISAFMEDYPNVSIRGLARRLNVSRGSIQKLVNDEKRITVDMAIRLGKFFNTSPEFWLDFSRSVKIKEKYEEIGSGLDLIQPFSFYKN